MYQFRDPVHGFIEVSELELKIIDSQPFQRLRNIRQLATTYLVYHGAEHTRFGHSLGVMYLVTRAFNSAVDNYERDNKPKKLFDNVTKAWYLQILRLIGLTHDLGHAPFSHASEALFEENAEHENFTYKIISETEIANYINEIGQEFKEQHNVGDEFDITPELLWLVYDGKNMELHERYRMPDFKFLKSFMDSELDCDKMDYLLRDSYYCGVNYGKYDINRLIGSLNVYKDSNNSILQLAVERGGLHAFEEFVIARYFMFIQVYFHKTRRYFDLLLVKSITSILENEKYPSDVQEYLKWNDELVLDKIKDNAKENECCNNYINRKVMSCVYETKAHGISETEMQIFNINKRDLKKNLDNDIITDTARKLTHKIPTLEHYDADSGKAIPILVEHKDYPSSITSESLLLQSLIKPINIKRIYVHKSEANKAREIIKKNLKNEGDDYE